MSHSHWAEATNTDNAATLLRVQIQPKASRSETIGPHGEPPRLKIRIAAPPVDGKANDELLRFLSKKLKIPKTQLQILRGHTSKAKDILCPGVSPETLCNMLDCKK